MPYVHNTRHVGRLHLRPSTSKGQSTPNQQCRNPFQQIEMILKKKTINVPRKIQAELLRCDTGTDPMTDSSIHLLAIGASTTGKKLLSRQQFGARNRRVRHSSFDQR